jgi:hypothetical protein
MLRYCIEYAGYATELLTKGTASEATDAATGRGDRTSWMFNRQKARDKLAQVHAEVGRTPMICKQQLEPAEINVSR